MGTSSASTNTSQSNKSNNATSPSKTKRANLATPVILFTFLVAALGVAIFVLSNPTEGTNKSTHGDEESPENSVEMTHASNNRDIHVSYGENAKGTFFDFDFDADKISISGDYCPTLGGNISSETNLDETTLYTLENFTGEDADDEISELKIMIPGKLDDGSPTGKLGFVEISKRYTSYYDSDTYGIYSNYFDFQDDGTVSSGSTYWTLEPSFDKLEEADPTSDTFTPGEGGALHVSTGTWSVQGNGKILIVDGDDNLYLDF